MRIIGGNFKGRTINAPNNIPARPTTDFAKTGLFNILNNHFDFEGLRVLDLFCGTGSISFEFVSRGAQKVICVEKNFKCANFIKTESAKLGMNALISLKTDAYSYLKNCTETFDVIFADPPYESKETGNIPVLVFEKKLLRENGLLVLEHSEREKFSDLPGFTEERHYGNVHFSFFRQMES